MIQALYLCRLYLFSSYFLIVLGKALHTLAKIGDEIYFEAQENQVVLSSVNAATTEFGWFKLLRQFFTDYYIADNLSKTETPDETAIGVKIRAKPLCQAFKCISLLDKNVRYGYLLTV